MNIARLKTMTVSEYLAWGNAQSERIRSELINGQIVAMAPERADHNRVKLATVFALKQAIKAAGLPCEAFTDGMTVPIDAHTAYEPDALVHCGTAIPPSQLTAPSPVIVAEVLSPTSAHSDSSAKLIGYFKLASVHHYLIVDAVQSTVTHHMRGNDGTIKAASLTTGRLRLDPPGIEFDVSDLFG